MTVLVLVLVVVVAGAGAAVAVRMVLAEGTGQSLGHKHVLGLSVVAILEDNCGLESLRHRLLPAEDLGGQRNTLGRPVTALCPEVNRPMLFVPARALSDASTWRSLTDRSSRSG